MKLRKKFLAPLAVVSAFFAIVSSANAGAIGAPRAQVSLDSIPGCSATFEQRFDAASRYVQGLPSSKGLAPEAIMRAYWKYTPLCAGDIVRTGGAETGDPYTIRGPKAVGQDIPTTVRGLVTDPVPLGKRKVAKRGRGGKTVAFSDCYITAWAPQFSGGAVRTGAYISCSQVRSLEIYANTYKLYNPANSLFNHRSAANSWQQVGIWTSFLNCVPTNSYRAEGIGSRPGVAQNSEYSSWLTGANDC